jgi:polyisoprenoid-binding protein YceI
MKKTTGILIITLLLSISAVSQNYITKTGHIRFYSETPIETIEAHNHAVNSALNIQTGDMVFKVLIKSFEFEKALMQEHFNENYMESDKYPNAVFKGKVMNLNEIDFSTEGAYEALIAGELTIRGITNPVEEKGEFRVEADAIHGQSVFNVLLDDYKIKVPGAVKKQISESIEVTVKIKLTEVKP